MRDLIIGDMHIGIKNNSISWLESQLEFFDKQIFDIIENKNIERVIFLGDLSDIRYSINQQVGIELKNLIRTLSNKYPSKEFFFIAGNPDLVS